MFDQATISHWSFWNVSCYPAPMQHLPVCGSDTIENRCCCFGCPVSCCYDRTDDTGTLYCRTTRAAPHAEYCRGTSRLNNTASEHYVIAAILKSERSSREREFFQHLSYRSKEIQCSAFVNGAATQSKTDVVVLEARREVEAKRRTTPEHCSEARPAPHHTRNIIFRCSPVLHRLCA